MAGKKDMMSKTAVTQTPGIEAPVVDQRIEDDLLATRANREYEQDVREELRATGTLARERGLSRGI